MCGLEKIVFLFKEVGQHHKRDGTFHLCRVDMW